MVTDETFTRKLLKEAANESTSKVLINLKERHPSSNYDVEQVRNRFKLCIRLVNKVIILAAMA